MNITEPDFAADVLEFAPKLQAFVARRVPDRHTAEDIVQEVFVKIFRARASLRDAAKLDAWIFQTARGTMIDHFRRQRPAAPLPESLPDEDRDLDEVGECMQRSVRRFLLTLPAAYREPLELVELRGLSVRDAAARLDLTESCVKSRLSRGRGMLGAKLLSCCQLNFDSYGRVIDFRQRAAPVSRGGECRCPAATYALARETDEPAIRRLLEAAGLPTSDLTPTHLLTFLTAKVGGEMVGCIGGEIYGEAGLLRSLAVDPAWRSAGIGTRLVAELGRLAAQLGLREIFLLTTTAAKFFEQHGFQEASRESAPAGVRTSPEFAALCPASAVLMHRRAEARPAKSD